MNDVTGIILAGGRSSRMGTEKGLVSVGGNPMISHVIQTLEKLGVKSIKICANDERYEQFNYPVIKDLVKGKGPIGGIYSALVESTTDKNVILSCDIPNISVDILQYLLENSEDELAAISSFEKKTHPLIGVYKLGGLSIIKECLENDQLRLIDMCEKLDASIVEIPGSVGSDRHFFNLNTPEELENSML
jgi:molybdopterin-guanine dinucleotide biosynthesis protein A